MATILEENLGQRSVLAPKLTRVLVLSLPSSNGFIVNYSIFIAVTISLLPEHITQSVTQKCI